MGLPILLIDFKTLARTAPLRSQNGICALILKDTLPNSLYTYNSYDEVSESWTAENKKYIELAFKGGPKKVLVATVGTVTPTLDTALNTLGNNKWNYLSYPDAETADLTKIQTWIKTKRNTDYKTYKFIGGDLTTPDDKGIINLTTDEIKLNGVGTAYTSQQFTSRIAGIACGVGVDSSLTNYKLEDVEQVKELTDDNARDTAINNGELILYNNGDGVVIARGVNSLKTIASTNPDDVIFKKIRTVEIIDLIRDDITLNINRNYKGRVINVYSNKLLLVGFINSYFAELEDNLTLDPDFNNYCEIDFTKQKAWLKSKGYKVEDMTDKEILTANTEDQVFLICHIKTTDVQEDFNVEIYV